MGARIQAALIRSGQWLGIALGASIPLSVALDNILLALIAACWLAAGGWLEKGEALRRNPVALAALALYGLLLAGSLWSAGGPAEAGPYLSRYADLLFIPVLAFLFRDAPARRRALYALAGSLVLVQAVSWWIAAGLPAGPPLLGRPDNPVVLKHYLTHSVLMAFGAFLCLQLARHAPTGRQRALWLAAAFGAAVNVFFTEGRTGYLILGVLAVCSGYAWLRWRGAALAAGASAAVFAVLVTVPGVVQERMGLVGDAPQTKAGRLARASDAERRDMYRITAVIIRDHPLLGVGTGGFPRAYAHRAPPEATVRAARNPHNEYLLMATQLGLPGLGLLLALFALHGRLSRRLASPLERDLARGLLLAIAAGCLFNSFLLDHTEGLLFAWLTGVLFGGLRARTA